MSFDIFCYQFLDYDEKKAFFIFGEIKKGGAQSHY